MYILSKLHLKGLLFKRFLDTLLLCELNFVAFVVDLLHVLDFTHLCKSEHFHDVLVVGDSWVLDLNDQLRLALCFFRIFNCDLNRFDHSKTRACLKEALVMCDDFLVKRYFIEMNEVVELRLVVIIVLDEQFLEKLVRDKLIPFGRPGLVALSTLLVVLLSLFFGFRSIRWSSKDSSILIGALSFRLGSSSLGILCLSRLNGFSGKIIVIFLLA